ncbi:MAG TPA: PQQ-dependent sugar dehydrogenase [Chitinophagaceae bacterium]|jgi:glucose/arabinose dehydrogenase
MTTLSQLTAKIEKKIFLILIFFFAICANYLIAQPTLGFNRIAQGLTSPVDIKNAGDDSKRLFIVEQSGTIRIYRNGRLLRKPFLNVSSIVKYDGNEAGLLSVAFPPNYKQSGYFFIYYSALNFNVTLARYHVSATNPNVADPNSGVILFSYPKPGGQTNHNGGTLQFGKDGYLYISIGDGGGEGDPFNNAQNGQSPFGKMHRIDINVTNAPYYQIPPDNPFVNDPKMLHSVWALGLRNPWKWSFDRKNGNMWIGDVGQNTWEEVDFIKPPQSAGSNYAWRCYEGNDAYNTSNCRNASNYDLPIFQYHHNATDGGACIIGGYVYRGSAFQQLRGYYICADYISGNAWKLKSNNAGGWDVYLQKNVPQGLVSFGEDETGELFSSTRNGNVYRITVQTSLAQSSPDSIISQTATYIYPTLVDNRTITLVLKDAFQIVRLIDMSGHEVMRKDISGVTGRTTLHLGSITPGMYIAELIGKNTMQQKIYITK